MSDVISLKILEAVDGSLVGLLGFMLVSALVYFWKIWRADCFRVVRASTEVHGAFAAVVLFCGLNAKNDVVWLWRHLINARSEDASLGGWINILLIASLAMVVLGTILWVRTIMPVRCMPSAWLWITICSVALGVWFAI